MKILVDIVGKFKVFVVLKDILLLICVNVWCVFSIFVYLFRGRFIGFLFKMINILLE